jgi:acyl-[acyl-carrier-protein] desaturase
LQKVAEDEARHYAFYVSLFKAIMLDDPNGALVAASLILPHIDMPGVSMGDFKNYLEVAAKMGIYALQDYQRVVRDVVRFWDVAGCTGLTEAGARAQETILALPGRIARVAERLLRDTSKKSFTFEVVYNRGFVL